MSAVLPRAAALGASAGAGWGVLARIWMRLISTDPGFSWSGTLLIVGLAALLGAGVGTLAQAVRAGRSRWWSLAVVPGLLIFFSPGMLLAPSFLVGALAYARRGRLLRGLGWTVIALTAVGGVLMVLFVPDPGGETTVAQDVVFGVGLTLMAVSMAWAGSHLWRPRVAASAATRPASGVPGSGVPSAAVREAAATGTGRGRTRRSG